METDSAADRTKLGVAFVLASGPSPWWGAERGDTTDWFIVAAAGWSAVPIAAHAVFRPGPGTLWTVLLLAGAAVFVVPIVVWGAARRWLFGTNVFVTLPIRIAGALAIALGLDLGEPWAFVGLCLLGVLAGCDATLSLRAVGIDLALPSSAVDFLRSSINLGVMLGLALMVGIDGWRAARVAAVLYGSLLLAVAVMLSVAVTFQAAERVVMRNRRDAERVVRDQERRERAHWIHDDVCAELRTVRLRLDAGALSADAVGRALGDLDHRLRLRQLDEQMAGGDVRLAEVAQPFVRMLQDRGIELSDVPRFDSANAVLDEATAKLVRRSLSVLTSNALNAGASRVGVRCAVDDDTLRIEVDDDAGGFRLDEVPAGRGLDGLRRDVISLTVDVGPEVTTVTVELSRARTQSSRRSAASTEKGTR